MHPRNEMRLLAGLPIDHKLEITEAREVPNRKDTAPATEKNLTKKLKDLAKATMHLENAAKALEAAPATDTNAEIPQIIKDIEELIGDVNVVSEKTAKLKPIKESMMDDANDEQLWMVPFVGNFYSGKYYEQGIDSMFVLASSAEEAQQIAEEHKDVALEHFKNKRYKKGSGSIPAIKEDDTYLEVNTPVRPTNQQEHRKVLTADGVVKPVQLSSQTPMESAPVKEMDISFDTSGADQDQEMVDTSVSPEAETEEAPASTSDFTEGDVILFDNGIWVVYKHDKEANKVGIIPPDLHGKEPEECAKAMQMVDPGKVRRPNNAESSILSSGADNKLGTEDDIRMESAKTSCPDCGCETGKQKPGCNCKTCKMEEEECEKMNESTLNYTPSNGMSWKEVDQNPANSVAQGEDNWKTEPRSERPHQSAENKDRNSDVVQTVKVPAKIKSALKKATDEFEAEAKRQGSGATGEENRQFYVDAAAAFAKLNNMLDGTFEGMQQAQIFASSLMGPMLHKLPSDVWKFISNGGQSRGLKDYMFKVKK